MATVVDLADVVAARSGLIARPRLLERMERRWEAAVLVVRASAGFGKSTLLHQAVAQNLVASLGTDILITCEPGDGEGASLPLAVGRALGVELSPREAADAGAAASAVRAALAARSPTPVCLVIDDVHELDGGGPGAASLAAVVDALPANGHVVLAGRADPPVALARLVAHGAVAHIDEDDLAFDGAELRAFARDRGVDVTRLPGGRWPALAELDAAAASSGGPAPMATGRDFVFEEVLRGVPRQQVVALAVLTAIGEADQPVLAAAVRAAGGTCVDLDALGALPLVSTTGSRARAHGLWAEPLEGVLDEAARRSAQRAAAAALLDAGRAGTALALAVQAEDSELARSCVRAATATSRPPTPVGDLQRWVALLDRIDPGCPEVALLRGIVAKALDGDPVVPRDLLLDAAARFRATGHIDAELTAYVHLLQVVIWTGDAGAQLEVLSRVTELAARGHPTARTLAGLGRAFIRRWAGEYAEALDVLRSFDTSCLDRHWAALVDCQIADVQMASGQLDEALATADRAEPDVGTEFAALVDTVRCYVHWLAGRWDECDRASDQLIARTETAGRRQQLDVALATTAYRYAATGDGGRAAAALDRVSDHASSWTAVSSKVAAATAALALAAGDEPAAAAALREDLERFPVEHGHWAQRSSSVALLYVLVPETRPTWDGAPLAPVYLLALELSRALVAARGGDLGPARRIAGSVDAMAPFLPGPFLAELATVRAEAGSGGDADVVLAVEDHPSWLDGARTHPHPGVARRAARVRARLPEPPPAAVHLRLLGVPEVAHGDGTEVRLDRARVRELALLLALEGEVARGRVLATLWPDLGQKEGANNLRVNLNHLRRALEPGRRAGAPSFLVRTRGDRLSLAPPPWLTVDVHLVRSAVEAGRAAERTGELDGVVDAGDRVVALYRGHLDDHIDAPWATAPTEGLRDRAVATILRAGEVRLAQGRPDDAVDLAERAAALDPWSERALRLLATAQLAAGRRAAARRTVDRCLALLEELGVGPDPSTVVLVRTLGGPQPPGAGRQDRLVPP